MYHAYMYVLIIPTTLVCLLIGTTIHTLPFVVHFYICIIIKEMKEKTYIIIIIIIITNELGPSVDNN